MKWIVKNYRKQINYNLIIRQKHLIIIQRPIPGPICAQM